MSYYENLPSGGFRILFYVGGDKPSTINWNSKPELDPYMDSICFMPINGIVIMRKVVARSLQREPELFYPGEII